MPETTEVVDRTPGSLIQMRPENYSVGVFASPAAFEHGQRMARALASSTMVPAQYRDNLPNVLVALDFAMRANLPPMMVLQGLNVIQGRPSWSAQFIVAAINGCGLFSSVRYEMRGTENTDSWGCRACATELAARTALEGPWVSIAMAKAEGWYGRTGSKWQTMPEVMLRWRAVSFFGRLYAAHILAGMSSTDELSDAGVFDAPAGSNGAGNPFAAPAPRPRPPVSTPPTQGEPPVLTTTHANLAAVRAQAEAAAPDTIGAALAEEAAEAPAPRRGRGRPPRVEPPAGNGVPETPQARREREAREAAATLAAPPAADPLDPGF